MISTTPHFLRQECTQLRAGPETSSPNHAPQKAASSPKQHRCLDRRFEVLLDGCGLPEAPRFKTQTPAGFGGPRAEALHLAYVFQVP